ncbi:sulfatase-like hydrolase/transferase [Radiobacillus sp. PE A8.2]|uniref:sulfatase-like hydrolase/transferase n=1 Tax=Radiobacillus sp. PE A8.2 TaxID=3380349 RepID=UPI00388FDCEF
MKRPNILIFMTDQQQNAVTYPDHPCQTPNLQQLAEVGIRYNHTYTTMAHCCPSRASFMTGLYPSQHGVYNNVSNPAAIHHKLNEGVTTFAEDLKGNGYSLHFSGKWHISAEENPSDRGWEELMVTANKDAYMGVTIEQWRERQNTPKSEERKPGEIVRPGWGNYQLYGTNPESLEETEDYQVVKKAVDRLGELKDQKDPWCMYVGTFGPHDPFIVPEKYAKMYDPNNIELPANYHDSLENKPGLYSRMRKVWDQLSEQEVKESIAHYWGYCTMVDDLFGLVMEKLESTNQAEDTLVLFLSDHGESLGAHGLYLKGLSPFDETYRIPCIMRWPKGIEQPGREINELISIMDFAPTFLKLAGIDKNKEIMGRSLVPWINNIDPKEWRDAVYTQCNGVEIYYSQRIVRTKNYKLVYNPTAVDELYDLRNDPLEMNNLAEVESMQEIKIALLKKFWQEAANAEDIIFNPYATIAVADVGPAAAIGKD